MWGLFLRGLSLIHLYPHNSRSRAGPYQHPNYPVPARPPRRGGSGPRARSSSQTPIVRATARLEEVIGRRLSQSYISYFEKNPTWIADIKSSFRSEYRARFSQSHINHLLVSSGYLLGDAPDLVGRGIENPEFRLQITPEASGRLVNVVIIWPIPQYLGMLTGSDKSL